MEYTRVNWENGEKTSDGYVIIDGETYNTVEPEYSGNTPVNAANLNVMDKGIEDAKEEINKLINSIITSENSGVVKLGKIGAEWGTVSVTPDSGNGGVYYGATYVTFQNTYKNAPSMLANSAVGYTSIVNVSTIGVTPTSGGVWVYCTSQTARNYRYFVVGELASSVPEEIQEVQENNEAQS